MPDLVDPETALDALGSVEHGGRIVSIAGPPTPGNFTPVAQKRRIPLTLPIDSRFPLDDYAAAFERLESRRSKGKVIVEIGA